MDYRWLSLEQHRNSRCSLKDTFSAVDGVNSCGEKENKDTVSYESNCTEILNNSETIADKSNRKVEMNTLETVADESSSKVVMNTLETVADECDSTVTMDSQETIADESNRTMEMNTLEILSDESNSTLEMNTFETVADGCSSTVTMDTIADESNRTVKMNTLETVAEENNRTIEMNTFETVCSSTVVMDSVKTITNECNRTIEMNTLEAVANNTVVMNTLETVSDECDSTVIMNTLETVVGDSGSTLTMGSVETVGGESTSTVKDNVQRITSACADDEPLCKKARLELTEPIADSCKTLSQTNDVSEEGTKHYLKKDKDSGNDNEIPSDSLNLTVGVPEHKTAVHKPSEDTSASRDRVDSSEKPSPLSEVQAGITEYLSSHKGFSAVIKQRYSDFIVNEIDMQGNVVHLTQMEPLESLDEEPAVECVQGSEITSDIISDEDIAKLENLLKSEDKKAVVNILAPADKDSRTKIHLAVKTRYAQLETKTADVDNQKMIQVMWRTGKSRDRNRDDWPASKKDYKYVKFVLYKENKDTMDAIGLIAKNLKLKEGLFQYAGTKDRRAKTSQEITAHRIHPKKLCFMNKVLWNMGLGNFQYVKEPLKLGQLSGNQFTIVLRNVQGSTEAVDSALSSLKTLGFVNYFGMQRFGTTLVPTHKVGCALLHSDWEKAVDLILMPRDDNPSKDAFQKVWMETRDPEDTLKVTPSYCGLERNLLEALKRKMKPFNALERISRNTRLLYIHSYQALVWNQMVSRRLKHFGLKPVVGDLVQSDDSDSSERASPTFVTQENLEQYTLHHVVLPLPGYDVTYPKNEVHSWYRETLAADGVDIDNMRRPQKDYSLPGAYRHITVCPTNVSWTHHRYDDYSLPLTLSDMDVIKGDKLPVSQNKGKFKAVVLKMALPTSSYATMALREALRVDTSAAHQTSLNVT